MTRSHHLVCVSERCRYIHVGYTSYYRRHKTYSTTKHLCNYTKKCIVNGGFFMSSSYPPFGNAPAWPCQRCGRPLPPNEVYCGNCGQYNSTEFNNSVAQPSSGLSWGAAPPQTSYSSDQNGGFQWGQPPAQTPQNNPFSGSSIPQQPFGPPSQPVSASNFYAASPQQSSTDNFYGAPGQPLRLSNFYPEPQQPLSPQQQHFSPQPLL